MEIHPRGSKKWSSKLDAFAADRNATKFQDYSKLRDLVNDFAGDFWEIGINLPGSNVSTLVFFP